MHKMFSRFCRLHLVVIILVDSPKKLIFLTYLSRCFFAGIRVILTCASERILKTWWRHQMETIFALLALCKGIQPVIGGFPSKRPVTRSFDVFFDLPLSKRPSKQPRGRGFQMPSRSLRRHCNVEMYNRPVLHNSLIVGTVLRCAILECLESFIRFGERNEKKKNDVECGSSCKPYMVRHLVMKYHKMSSPVSIWS